MTEKEYFFSLNEEQFEWSYYGKTMGDAKKGAMERLWDENGSMPDKVYSYWIGEAANPLDLLRAKHLGDRLFDDILECHLDEVHNDDGPCLSIQEADLAGLGQVVIDYLREHATVNYSAIDNVLKFFVTEEELVAIFGEKGVTP